MRTLREHLSNSEIFRGNHSTSSSSVGNSAGSTVLARGTVPFPLRHSSDCKSTQQARKAKTPLAFFLGPNALRRIQGHDGGLKFQQLDELIELGFATFAVHEDFNFRTSSPGSPGFNVNHGDMLFLWKHA